PGKAPEKPRDELAGAVLAGNFRILEKLGEGDLGNVYGAKDVTREKHVALKVLRSELSKNPDYVLQFQKDIKAAIPIRHPGLVPIFLYGSDQFLGRVFVARQITGGVDVSQLVASKGPLEPQRAVKIAVEVLEALATVHAAGLVHGRLSSRKIRVEG